MLSLIWMVLISSLLWSVFYALLCRINYKKNHEWNCRIVAIIHALVLTKIIDLICFVIGPWPFSHFAEPNTILQNLALSVSAGYFIFDTIWCAFMQTEGILMIFHHVISLISLIGGLLHGNSASEITAVIWGSELTNPFLQIRWFLKQTKQYDSMFAKVNDLIFLFLFALVRVGLGSYLCLEVLLSHDTMWWIKFGGVGFHSISFIWMWQIIQFARRRFAFKY